MRVLLAALLAVVALPALAQADSEVFASADVVSSPRPAAHVATPADDAVSAPAYYVTRPSVGLCEAPDPAAQVLTTLRTRDGVRVLDAATASASADWRLVQVGAVRGYVPAEAISNVWIRVDKSDRTVYVYRGAELIRELPADVSVSPEDKVRRSGMGETEHYRVPEGTFYVTRRNDDSNYYRAFVISYPDPVHALAGFQSGLITRAEYEAIVRADQEGVEPPMNTMLGGLVELHGQGSGRRRAWTRGCVALRNVHMDELWAYVEVGTPVVIEP